MSRQDNFSQYKTHWSPLVTFHRRGLARVASVYQFNVTYEKDIHVETDRVGDGILTNHSIRTERR